MLLILLDFLIRKNILPTYVMNRIWFCNRKYALNGNDYKAFSFKIGKAGFYISLKTSVVGYYYQEIPF